MNIDLSMHEFEYMHELIKSDFIENGLKCNYHDAYIKIRQTIDCELLRGRVDKGAFYTKTSLLDELTPAGVIRTETGVEYLP